jgi:hypothetical protein
MLPGVTIPLPAASGVDRAAVGVLQGGARAGQNATLLNVLAASLASRPMGIECQILISTVFVIMCSCCLRAATLRWFSLSAS